MSIEGKNKEETWLTYALTLQTGLQMQFGQGGCMYMISYYSIATKLLNKLFLLLKSVKF